MLKALFSLILILATSLLTACGDMKAGESFAQMNEISYESGLRAGHADVKTFGYCDHPFPRDHRSQATTRSHRPP